MQKILDLTHLLHNEMPVYPGSEKPILQQIYHIREHGWAETKLSLHSHHGTHMDAPAHMIKGAKTLDQFEPDKFYGKAICIDCTSAKDDNIEIQHVNPYENVLETIDFVLLYTGWSEKWGTDGYFSGFPVLTKEACKWLSGFNLKGIGLDNISLDRIDTLDYANHNIILGKDMIIIENLKNLKYVGIQNFTFSCFPIKYPNADGSPIRAVAIL
jgi:arylformamidase